MTGWHKAAGQGRAIGRGGAACQARESAFDMQTRRPERDHLSFARAGGNAAAMPDKSPALSREERLAAKLRENLRRRKVQARALSAEEPGDSPPSTPEGNRLSKAPPKS